MFSVIIIIQSNVEVFQTTVKISLWGFSSVTKKTRQRKENKTYLKFMKMFSGHLESCTIERVYENISNDYTNSSFSERKITMRINISLVLAL